MTHREALREGWKMLTDLYDEREASLIAEWVMEHITGESKTRRLMRRDQVLTEEEAGKWKNCMEELLRHRPVQYVLQEAWFAGRKFFVNEQVLIPRPETEELVNLIIRDRKGMPEETSLSILDIGTGSGCIAISLAAAFPKAEITACDISPKALEVASRNASNQAARVKFIEADIRKETDWSLFSPIDIIVSNPPYVPLRDRQSMSPHVLEYEPHTALFVEDEDALLFYRIIARFGKKKLKAGGFFYLEIHEEKGEAVRDLMIREGYGPVDILPDLQGKDRICRAGTSHQASLIKQTKGFGKGRKD